MQGPCSAEELTGVFENISMNEVLTADSVYVFHHANSNTANGWEPWSNGIAHPTRSNSMGALESRRTHLPFSGGDSAARMLNFDGGSSTSAVSARDHEVGQQGPRTEENDRAAFHVIVDSIE